MANTNTIYVGYSGGVFTFCTVTQNQQGLLQFENGKKYILTITVKDSYADVYFNPAHKPYLQYSYTGHKNYKNYAVLSNNNKTATITIPANTIITDTNSVSLQPGFPTDTNSMSADTTITLSQYLAETSDITVTLTGLTANSNNPTVYSSNADTVLLFTVNNDYKDPVVTATYTNSAGTQTINGVVDGNTVTLTIPSGITGITSGISVNGVATEIYVDNIPIAFNLTGCSNTGIQTYSSKSDADTTIRLTADSGFSFTTEPTGSYKYDNANFQFNFTRSENNTVASYTLPHGMDTVTDITVNAVATADIETADIVYSLNHCSNNGITKYSSDKQSDIVLTAESGFEFTSQPTAVYTANGLSKTIKGVISDNKLSATITLPLGITGITTDISVTGNATAIVVPVTHIVNYTLANCTSSGETTYYDNSDLVITLTANTGYVFKAENLPRAYWHSAIQGDNTVNAILQNEGKNAVITIPSGISYDITNDTIEITGTAESDGSNHTHNILYTLSNAQHNNVTQYTDNDTINIELTADADCLFSADNKPKISYTYIQDNPFAPTVGMTEDFTLSPDRKKALFTLSGYTISGDIEVTGVATVQTPVETGYGIVTIYKPTAENLDAISRLRFTIGVDTEGLPQVGDIAQYISVLKKFYIDIPTTKSEPVKLQNYVLTDVVAPLIENDRMTIDCGSIEVKGLYNNAIDLKAETSIYLPFCNGLNSISTDKIMNKIVRLVYEVSLLNGQCVAKLYDTANNVLATFNGDVSIDIPFMSDWQTAINGKIGNNVQFLYGFIPFIQIKEQSAIESVYGFKTYKPTMLKNEISGYCEVENIELDGINATLQEKEEITRLLSNGIIL